MLLENSTFENYNVYDFSFIVKQGGLHGCISWATRSSFREFLYVNTKTEFAWAGSNAVRLFVEVWVEEKEQIELEVSSR